MKSLRHRVRASRATRAKRLRCLPLAAFYRKEPEQEVARTRFYDRCARIFGWEDWTFSGLLDEYDDLVISRIMDGDWKLPEPGHGGRGREIAAIERNRLIAINLNSSPFEWLASHGYLEVEDDASGAGNVRFSAGIKVRDLMVGAEPAGLRSFNLEGTSGGGGVPIVISDFKLDCLMRLQRIAESLRSMAPRRVFYSNARDPKKRRGLFSYRSLRIEPFSLLHRIIYLDEWIFDGMGRDEQKMVLTQFHFALDVVAMDFGMMTPREFNDRWAKAIKGAA